MRAPSSLHLLLAAVLLLSLLAACSPAAQPPAASPTPRPTLPALTLQPPPGSKQPETATPLPTFVLPSLTPAPTLTLTPSLTPSATPWVVNRRDAQAVIDALRKGLEQKDVAAFAALLGPAAQVSYVNYIEGSQPVERARFLDDLSAGLANSAPLCDAYSLYENTLQVWTSGWLPDWQMTRLCYADCQKLDPPYQSRRAAFFFDLTKQNEYQLATVWLADNQIWRDVYKVQMHSCSEPYASAVAVNCPGAPKTRLKVGDYAQGSTASSTSSRVRSAPGTAAGILGLLPPGKAVEVIGGPECANGYLWWRIQFLEGDLVGWTAEGQGSDYWLVPCASKASCGTP